MMPDDAPSTIAAFICMRIKVFRQTAHQVFKRKVGHRSLTGPYPVRDEALIDWEFAMLSVAAYGRSAPKRHAMPVTGIIRSACHRMMPSKRVPPKRSVEPDVDEILVNEGWTMWEGFPEGDLANDMKDSHLRAEVWEHQVKGKIVVAFGGTVFTSGKDWYSNFRWFIPWRNDEYTDLVSRFSPAFVEEFIKKKAERPKLGNAELISTGHSLGGGLAQQFAYSLRTDKPIQRVSQVFAFDPSPVTGFRSVLPAIRDENKTGLQIARIYERGEILAILRSFTSLFLKPSTVNPAIRGVRFSLFRSINWVADHSMANLANKMRDAAKALRKDEAARDADLNK